MKHKVSEEQKKYHRFIAEQYYKFLQTIKDKHPAYLRGIQEGQRKFLTNMYGYAFEGRGKHVYAQYISKEALLQVKKGIETGLWFEHVVPKQKFIQRPLVEDESLTVEKIHEMLNKYYITALITEEENKKLRKGIKKADFKQNVFARYEGRVDLLKNEYFKIQIDKF